jgi:para-aminobenzoate synthetase component I
MLKHELNYHHDSALLFERIAQQPWAQILDSGQMLNPATGKPGSQYGRYDILVAEPFITLVTQGEITTITQNGVAETLEEDPFLLLKNLLSQYKAVKSDLPFCGGALGYFAYDLARRLEKLPANALHAVNMPEMMPEMMVAIYDWAVVVDHRDKRSFLVSHGLNAQTYEKWPALLALFNAPSKHFESSFEVTTTIKSNLTKAQYSQNYGLYSSGRLLSSEFGAALCGTSDGEQLVGV